jgi:hypothetical protein
MKLDNYISSFSDDFQVQTAQSVEDAIEAIVSIDFSLILCEPSLAILHTGLVPLIMEHKPALPILITGQDDSLPLKEFTGYRCVKGFIPRPIERITDLAVKVVLALDTLFYQGNLREVSCMSLIQILGQGCNDYTLRIINIKEEIEGILFVKSGVLLNAISNNTTGLKAAIRILSWGTVDVEVYNICPLKEDNVNTDMLSLIFQCANKQPVGKQPFPATGEERSTSSVPLQTGGLAGLFLKKAKQR